MTMPVHRSLAAWLTALFALALFATPLAAGERQSILRLPPEAGLPHLVLIDTLPPVPRDHGPVSRIIVAFESGEQPGTIIISNREKYLYRILADGKAERYTISTGRDGFSWTGTVYIGAKEEWPGWRPPAEMRVRQPALPDYVPPGPYNPLGARALYLYQNGQDTLYRIHGTNDTASLGSYQTSGCFRMSNADVMTLYRLVPTGTKVIVR